MTRVMRWFAVVLLTVPVTLGIPGGQLLGQNTPGLPPLNEPPSNETLPGKFIWFDMAAPDVAAQQAFYSSVFGWSFKSPARSDDLYRLAFNQGQAVAGLFQYEPPGGEQDGATWIALMSSDDIDATRQRVVSNGGSVELGPANVPGRGRHALFRDPAGALFGALQSSSGDPLDTEVPVGGILWLDLFARDIDAMSDFYEALAPYTKSTGTVVEDIERVVLSAHGLARAGIVPADEEANRSAWVPYVRVDDVETTLERVVEGGGFAIVPPDERLHDGKLAVFVDPHGGVTGIVEWEYRAEDEDTDGDAAP